MSEKPNGLFVVHINGTRYFDDVTEEEGLSGLLTVADHFGGCAYLQNDDMSMRLIADFRK